LADTVDVTSGLVIPKYTCFLNYDRYLQNSEYTVRHQVKNWQHAESLSNI